MIDGLRAGLADLLADLAPGPQLALALAEVPELASLCSTELALVVRARSRQVNYDQAELLAASVELALAGWQSLDDPTERLAAFNDFSADQIAFTLTWSRPSAESFMELGWDLTRRLPMVFEALRQGRLDRSRARQVVIYARVSSAEQRSDLDRQVARVTSWATAQRQLAVSRVVTEVGSALDGHRKKFLALLRDPKVSTIVVEHRDRFARFGAEYVEAALAAQGRRLLVVDPAEVDDDLVRDVTEILTSLCARLYGRRAAVTGPVERSTRPRRAAASDRQSGIPVRSRSDPNTGAQLPRVTLARRGSRSIGAWRESRQ